MHYRFSLHICLAVCLLFGALAASPAQAARQFDCPEEGCQPVFLPVLGVNGNMLPGTNQRVCLVTDTLGIDDQGFNSLAWKGVQDAQTGLGVTGTYLEAATQADYAVHINTFIADDCDLIVTVGFSLEDATKTAAVLHTDQKFAIVDISYDPVVANILGLTFATEEPSFLAGYLAAGMSQAGTVGTFGGVQIPPVTDFMDGFYYGVQYYNQQKSASVQVLGWNATTQTGLFVGNFESVDDGRTMAETLISEGADVIFPVAGQASFGAADAVLTADDTWVIGVDTDWIVQFPQYSQVVLTSSVKGIDSLVYEAIRRVVYGTFSGGDLRGTLSNGGVRLGTVATGLPTGLLSELETIRAGIIAGTIPVRP